MMMSEFEPVGASKAVHAHVFVARPFNNRSFTSGDVGW